MNTEDTQKKVAELIKLASFEVPTSTYDETTDTYWFPIEGSDARILLSRGGDALSALNYLANKIIEKGAGENTRVSKVIIDAGGFEKKKIDNLKTIAHMMAERARYFKSSIDIEPMSPRDRKIVHEFLSTLPDIKTESVGEGPKRHIVIRYTGGI